MTSPVSRPAGRTVRTDRAPLLVTGVPRSGTTWLARALAGAHGAAMTGREPMNPRPGQFALAGTLSSWVRLDHPSAQQERVLRRAYAGLEPRVYGKYGHRQWAAPLPGTRVVVKDPFALLSIPGVVRATGAVPVLVYRHPAAVLRSYRRMQWRPDVAELVDAIPPDLLHASGVPTPTAGSDIEAMAWFWAVLNGVALRDLEGLDRSVVVSHEDVAGGGSESLAAVLAACGLRPGRPTASGAGQLASGPTSTPGGDEHALHRLDRAPEAVASEWRSDMSPEEVEAVDQVTGPVMEALTARSVGRG